MTLISVPYSKPVLAAILKLVSTSLVKVSHDNFAVILFAVG